MTTLTFEIRGLCALVPNEIVPEEREQDAFPISRLRVLVLDAAILAARRGLTLCAHKPQITIQHGGAPQSFDLRRHRIEIEGLIIPDPAEVQLQPAFWDVARINQVTRGPLDIANSFLLLDQPDDGVVASLRLMSGTAKGTDSADRELTFDNDAQQPYKGKFARAVELSLEVDDSAKIHFIRFGDNDPVHSIDLVPDAGNSIYVTLTNLCDQLDAESEGTDFAVYYSLLSAYDGPAFLPRASDRKPRRGEVRAGAVGSDSGCIPTTFNDHQDA